MDQPPHRHDVCVVGAGPAGATCAFYLARQGHDVLLLDQHRFPRDKICGDAVCRPAHRHLATMGVLPTLLAAGTARYTESGGFVSPSGLRYVGNSAAHDRAQLVLAVKRRILDDAIARSAQAAGAVLREGQRVISASLDRRRGEWLVCCDQAGERRPTTFRARVLVSADGASSLLGRALGLVTSAPQAVCSRAYVRAGSHSFPYDGMVYYPTELLPGYAAIQREADGDLNFCVFVVPGGRCRPRDLGRLHRQLLETDPFITADLGASGPGKLRVGRMRGGALRLRAVAHSAADHLLLVGDAAGQIDPLTGEGIHYAMDGAELAARTLNEALAAHDLGGAFLERYHRRWMRAFGRDFSWSRRLSLLQGACPWLLDAFADASNRQGMGFMIHWARIMTGIRPKRDLLAPSLALPLLPAMARQALGRLNGRCSEAPLRSGSRRWSWPNW